MMINSKSIIPNIKVSFTYQECQYVACSHSPTKLSENNVALHDIARMNILNHLRDSKIETCSPIVVEDVIVFQNDKQVGFFNNLKL